MIDPARVRTLVLFREFEIAHISDLLTFLTLPTSQSVVQAKVPFSHVFRISALTCSQSSPSFQENQLSIQGDTVIVWICTPCYIFSGSCQESTRTS